MRRRGERVSVAIPEPRSEPAARTASLPLVLLLTAGVALGDDTPDNTDCDGNAGESRWHLGSTVQFGSAFAHQTTIEEKKPEECVPGSPPPAGGGRPGGPGESPTGQDDPETIPLWECPYDRNFYEYDYNSVTEAEQHRVFGGGNPGDFYDNLPDDFWTKMISVFDNPVNEGVPPSTSEGDEFECDKCPNPNCDTRLCERGGFYSAVEYRYRQYIVRKQVEDVNGVWANCTECEAGTARSFTFGLLKCARVKNSQRPFVDPLLTVSELCDRAGGDGSGGQPPIAP